MIIIKSNFSDIHVIYNEYLMSIEFFYNAVFNIKYLSVLECVVNYSKNNFWVSIHSPLEEYPGIYPSETVAMYMCESICSMVGLVAISIVIITVFQFFKGLNKINGFSKENKLLYDSFYVKLMYIFLKIIQVIVFLLIFFKGMSMFIIAVGYLNSMGYLNTWKSYKLTFILPFQFKTHFLFITFLLWIIIFLIYKY